MSPSLGSRYEARATELAALRHEVEGDRRPDLPVVVGLLLECAGDLLRRRASLGGEAPPVLEALAIIPGAALEAWGRGVDVAALRATLARAASRAVEAALPDEPEAGRALAQWALEDLRARDRLESALVALGALGGAGRVDARREEARLRAALAPVDAEARRRVPSLTALNGLRRAELGLLDAPVRAQAWWYADQSGLENDGLVQVLGGAARGTIAAEAQAADALVRGRRRRPIGFDELLRLDLGLASAAEREAVAAAARVDPELALALAAMRAADEGIDGPTSPEPTAAPALGRGLGTEEDVPEVIDAHRSFQVLVFRRRDAVRLAVQPRGIERFAAAAVYRSERPGRPLPSRAGPLGLQFDLGAPGGGATARVVVTLADGATHALEIPL